jgi:xanthine dehydrogenase molybdopterin-binding subunit B
LRLGEIANIDTSDAEKLPGVLAIITHKNAPKLNVKGGLRGGALLQGPGIEFYGQHIGMVVAETFEQARYAARLVKVDYSINDARIDFEKLAKEAVLPKDKDRADKVRGDVDAAISNSEVSIEVVYETPIEHHHPMEPHATYCSVGRRAAYPLQWFTDCEWRSKFCCGHIEYEPGKCTHHNTVYRRRFWFQGRSMGQPGAGSCSGKNGEPPG